MINSIQYRKMFYGNAKTEKLCNDICYYNVFSHTVLLKMAMSK